MPKLWIISDLHLEAVAHPEAFDPARPDFDVLVVAGDVWQGQCLSACRTVARLAAGKPAVLVLGNHEHWNGVAGETIGLMQAAAEEHGIILLEHSEAHVGGVRFIGATLWGDGRLGQPQL